MLLTGIIFYLYYKQRLRKSKEKEQKTKLELQSIQAQLNPHFVFNALNSIQYLVNRDDRPAATTYLEDLSQLIRNSLYNNEKEMLPLSLELETLESYIKLEKLRFNFQYSIIVDTEINQTSTPIPTLLVQPLIENAIKHGIGNLKEKGLLQIKISSKDKNMIFHIEDNGKGYDTAIETNGFGLRLVRERILILNKSNRITMKTNSSTSGTIVEIIFYDWL